MKFCGVGAGFLLAASAQFNPRTPVMPCVYYLFNGILLTLIKIINKFLLENGMIENNKPN